MVTRFNSKISKAHELDALAALVQKYGKDEVWELVKADHSRAKRVPQEIDEFDIGEWEKVAAPNLNGGSMSLM